MRTLLKHALFIVALSFGFVANPAFFGCSEEEEEDFDFGESEMRTFIEGTWTGSMDLRGSTTPFTLILEQSAATTAGGALCGERSFVKPAAACVAISTMPVRGTLSSDDGRFTDAPVTGNLDVMGADFNNAMLWLTLGAGLSLSISSSDGVSFASEGDLYTESGHAGSVTMSRLTR